MGGWVGGQSLRWGAWALVGWQGCPGREVAWVTLDKQGAAARVARLYACDYSPAPKPPFVRRLCGCAPDQLGAPGGVLPPGGGGGAGLHCGHSVAATLSALWCTRALGHLLCAFPVRRRLLFLLRIPLMGGRQGERPLPFVPDSYWLLSSAPMLSAVPRAAPFFWYGGSELLPQERCRSAAPFFVFILSALFLHVCSTLFAPSP